MTPTPCPHHLGPSPVRWCAWCGSYVPVTPATLTAEEAAALAWATASHTTPHYHAEALAGLAARMTQNNGTPDA